MRLTTALLFAALSMTSMQAAVGQVSAWESTSIASVRAAAEAGDKTAQFELGRRYESGRGGASCDLKSAKHWYSRAARSNSGNRLAYSAPVGSEKTGRFVSVGRGAAMPGLPEATFRLKRLRDLAPSASRCMRNLPDPVLNAVGGDQPPPLNKAVGGFLEYSKAWPTYEGILAYVTPVDSVLPKKLEAFAQPRDSRIGPIVGLFGYSSIDCFEAGRRVSLAAPRELCGTASFVARYTFHLDPGRDNCLRYQEAASFLAARGWQRTTTPAPASPPSLILPRIVSLEAEFLDDAGGLIVVSPILPNACLTDFYLYRQLTKRGM